MLFSLTWFGKSLIPGSGANLWRQGSVSILNQPPYKLDIPVNWLDDPFDHRSWRWVLNSFQWMDKLLSDFKNNKDEAAIQKCVNYFFDWADFYITKGQSGEFLWKDDAVSFRTLRLSIIATYIFNSGCFAEEKKELTREVVYKHYLELSDPKKFKSNNHGIFQMRALICLLALHPSVGNVEKDKAYAAKRINWLWEKQYGTQNMHLENSTGYHQYIVKEFEEILDSPEFSGIRFNFDKDKIQEVKGNTRFLFHPNGTSTLFGDSNFVRHEHEVVMGDYVFNEAGYAILAGNEPTKKNSYLAVRTGFPSNAHRHSDDFSLEWSEKGQVILQDSGRYSYDYNNPYRIFVSSARAHNTVSVDGGNFPWWGDFDKTDYYAGAVTFFRSGKLSGKLVLEKKFSKPDVNFNRSLEIKRGKSLRVIDTLRSSSIHFYEQWFHLAENFAYKGEDVAGHLIFETDSLILYVFPPENSEILVSKGQEQPFIQGWVSYQEKHIIPRWSFGFRKNELKKCTFDTMLEICEKEML
ncbi:heparinase II/III domain-containing protein [Billgrantia saliphila]|uniref:heparinase II/III domain-containing protein n=1 Tax=Billgrantia saliphila TaxID=1848458 RepID=UPI0018CC0EE8|nr:heparinase II/III family protein [Halomonas saliphila]